MRRLAIVVVALMWAITTLSCHKEIDALETKDALGIIVNKKPVWQLPSTADPKKAEGRVNYSSIINGDVLDDYSFDPANGKVSMTLRNPETGERRWDWNDVLRDSEPVSLVRRSVYHFENYLFYNYGPRNYCIDTRTGQTIWRKSTGYSAFPTAGILGSVYFTKGTPQALQDQYIVEDRVYIGDVKTGIEREIAMPRYSRKNIRQAASWKQWIGVIADVQPIVEGGDTLLLIPFTETAYYYRERTSRL